MKKIPISRNSRISLFLGIISTIFTLCCCNIKGIPLSIIFAIFSLSFIYLSKIENSGLNKYDIISLILDIWGLLIGSLLFIIILNASMKLQDPKLANEVLQKLKNIFDSLNIDLQDFYGF